MLTKSNLLVLTAMIFLFGSCSINSNITYLGEVPPEDIPIVFKPEIVSLPDRIEQGFTISPDGKEILLGIIGEHDSLDCIYYTTLTDTGWSIPVKPYFIDSDSVFFPMFSPDGTQLTYTKRAPGEMQTDIRYSLKGEEGWSEPESFAFPVNSTYREGSSSLSGLNNIYFTSNRDTAFACCGDIYRASLSGDSIMDIQRLHILNTNDDEEGVFISPKEDYIIIQSWKAPYQTKHDLYISYRQKSGNWTIPVKLDSTINTIDLEQRPFVTADNKYLFFNRFELDEQFNPVESDIYWVSTKGVFSPYVYSPLQDITITPGHTFEWQLPEDVFKDVDDTSLEYSMQFNDADWLLFDEELNVLSGTPINPEEVEITVLAKDGNGNVGLEKFILTVRSGFVHCPELDNK